MIVSANLGYVSDEERQRLMSEAAAVKAMLNGLMESLVPRQEAEPALVGA